MRLSFAHDTKTLYALTVIFGATKFNRAAYRIVHWPVKLLARSAPDNLSPMSSLTPERLIAISPSLATTIGLEETVMLQVLTDISAFNQGQDRNGYLWFNISTEQLQQLLPFWNTEELQRIGENLQQKGVILLNPVAIQQCGFLSFAMNEEPQAKVAVTAATTVSTTNKIADEPIANTQGNHVSQPKGAELLAANWKPSEDLLQLLSLNHNIPSEFALSQLEDFLLYWRDRQQVSHSWPSKFRQHVLKEWRFHQSREAATQQITHSKDINNSWRPSQDAIDILLRADVNSDFIDDAVPEFVLYWSERGQASNTWNSKFIAHIRRQWAQYNKTMELDYEPREISASWQPNEDVYDILRLANIDIEFARQLVPEFVLFWRDTKQIHRSWNTKFLQHAKYQWATRHQMGQHYAGQQNVDRSASSERKSTFDLLTDRSWAEDLVKDS